MRIPVAFAVLLLVVFASIGALAQELQDGIDYKAWDSVAERAETAIEAGLASDRALEDLRNEIVDWRERFLGGRDVNADRIETLTAQLEALGPTPADGEPEADGVAEQRADLAEQLAEAQAPAKAAEVAFSHAGGLIGEIDTIIRDRRANALLRKSRSPLKPDHWGPALVDLAGSLRSIHYELRESWSSDVRFRLFMDGLPRNLFLLALSAILLFRGGALLRGALEGVRSRIAGRPRRLVEFALSAGEFALPLLGIFLLKWAVEGTSLLGTCGTLVVSFVPSIGFWALSAYWLASRFYPDHAGEAPLDQSDARRAGTIRQSATLLGLMIGLSELLEAFAELEEYTEENTAVLLFLVTVAAAFGLVLIGLAIRSYAIREGERSSDGHAVSWPEVLGLALVILAILGSLLAAFGYLYAGPYLLVATGKSLALLVLLYLLNGILHELYGLALDVDENTARTALVPTLLGLAVALAALPVFSLIWGTRIADLTEIWARVREGFTFGDVHIAPETVLAFAIVFIALFLATRVVQATLRNNVLPKTKIDSGGQVAIVSGVGYVGLFLAALLATTAAGINLSSVAVVVGALFIGIGFGLQNIALNFVSGIILLIERPVSEGDWIEVGEHVGIVKKISVRSTLIQTFDRTDVIVPNDHFISGSVINWTRRDNVGRIKVQVGVAYGTDTRRVARILYEIASEHPVVTKDPEPGVDFVGFGADSLDFRIRAVLSDVNQSLSVMSELNHRIAERFAEEGIEIPFAQRDIWLRNPETLGGTKPEPEVLDKAANDRKRKSLPKGDPEIDPELMDGDGDIL